jgi:hypothetical protein
MRGLRILLNLLLLFLVLGGSSLLVADETSAMWTRLYERAVSTEQKRQIMMNIVEQDNRDLAPVLRDALAEQLNLLRETRDTTEKRRQRELMKMIVAELGDLKAREAASLVWETVQAAEDPLLRGEAIQALGRMNTRQYGEEMAMMLRNLNFNYDDIQKQRENEILAYSLVLALKRMRIPESFSPLFFASQGWYSGRSQVKEQAREALQVVVDDPTEQLLEIVRTNADYNLKLAALQAEAASDAPDEGKARVAAAALNEGLRNNPENVRERQELKSLRLEALRLLRNKPFPTEQKLLENMGDMLTDFRTDRLYEQDEILTLLETMGTFEREGVARELNEFLLYLTERRNSGITMPLRIARQTIQSLASTGQEIAQEGLTMVTISTEWEGSVKREAQAALERLQQGN